MPAALLTGLRRFEVDDVPLPEPKRGEALVELEAVGICGSDLHYWRMGRIGSQAVRFPAVLGHEPAGTVVALGPGVRRIAEGQRVAVEPGVTCGRCRECALGWSNLCSRVRFLGAPGCGGAFQRYLAMPETCLEPLPERVDAVLGSAAEPLGVALHALDLVRLRAGERVAVVGGGPVGLCVVALAQRLGARVVALCEPRLTRRKVARSLGAERTVEAEAEAFLKAARTGTRGAGPEVVVECAGSADGLAVAIAAAARGGRVAVVGIPEVDAQQVDPHLWRRKELDIVQVRRSNQTLRRILRLLKGPGLGLQAAGFFSPPVGLDGLQETFERLEDAAATEVKVIVDPRRT